MNNQPILKIVSQNELMKISNGDSVVTYIDIDETLLRPATTADLTSNVNYLLNMFLGCEVVSEHFKKFGDHAKYTVAGVLPASSPLSSTLTAKMHKYGIIPYWYNSTHNRLIPLLADYPEIELAEWDEQHKLKIPDHIVNNTVIKVENNDV